MYYCHLLIAMFIVRVDVDRVHLARQSRAYSARWAPRASCGRSNLSYRVDVKAGMRWPRGLRGFKRMMHELEANARELERPAPLTEAILESSYRRNFGSPTAESSE